MRRLAALGLLLALAVPAAALASERHPTQNELEGEIMCPVCGTTLDQSDAAVAQQMKMFIRARIAAGDTKSQIENKLASKFGEQVLAAPSKHGFNLLAWLLPLVGLGLAVPIVGYAAWRWSRARPPDDAPPVDPELDRRVDQELARFESS